jgi:hypothetical protein
VTGEPEAALEMDRYALVLLRRPAGAPLLAEADPAVRAGRLAVEVWTWLTRPGAIRFPDPPGRLE